MSRSHFSLELQVELPRLWVDGPSPPPAHHFAVIRRMRVPFLEMTDDDVPLWRLLADSIRENLRADPTIIDDMAKRLIDKVENSNYGKMRYSCRRSRR